MVAASSASGTVTLFPVNGGTPRVLEGERGVPIEWSRDGRWLLLVAHRDLAVDVYRRELSTGGVEPWRSLQPSDLSGAVAVGNVLLSADASLCVYTCQRISNQLFLMEGVR